MAAQTTAIPDQNFEQRLIDLEIDSDGEINGQVLTSNIGSVTEIYLGNAGIWDLTGIEYFASLVELNINNNPLVNNFDISNNTQLEMLMCDFTDITELNLTNNLALKFLYCDNNNLTSLDVTNNIILEEISFGNHTDDVSPFNEIPFIDLSNNPLLTWVSAENMLSLEFINLNNYNNVDLNIDVLRMWETGPIVCLQVDDAEAASNGQAPYSSWTILGPYEFSNNCNLSVNGFENIDISIFPNPSSETIQFQLPIIFHIEKNRSL